MAPTPPRTEIDFPPSHPLLNRLSAGDLEIAQVAKAVLQNGEEPFVVTEDLVLARFLADIGISSLSGAQFIEITSQKPINKTVDASAKKVVTYQIRHLIWGFVSGVVSSLLGALIYENIALIASTIPVWGTVVAIPLIGVGLFWYREHFRLSYGVFEFFVGLIMSYYVFFPSFDYSSMGLAEGIQLLGGIYVMVRGLDNVGKGIAGTRLESLWERLF